MALLEGRYAGCEQVSIALHNVTTQTAEALHEGSGPQRARASVERIGFRYTPPHDSWLHVA